MQAATKQPGKRCSPKARNFSLDEAALLRGVAMGRRPSTLRKELVATDCDHRWALRQFDRMVRRWLREGSCEQLVAVHGLPLNVLLDSARRTAGGLNVPVSSVYAGELVTPRRCPGCGGMINVLPCFGCYLAQKKERVRTWKTNK